MKKANIKAYNQEYLKYILIENTSDLIDYFDEKLRGMQKESAVEIIQRARSRVRNEFVPHTIDVITHATELKTETTGRGCIWNQAVIMADLQNQMINYISQGKRIAISPFNGVSHFTLPSDAEVEILPDVKYTKDDIKVSKYPYGCHWYARIANIDVVISNQNKWHSEVLAYSKAREFLLTL